MRIAVFIPAFNEQATIGDVVKSVRQAARGAQVLVVDDGSTDSTAAAAARAGAKVLRHGRNLGLARSFCDGMEAALKAGAGIAVCIDADGQYDPKEIPKLIKPVAAGEADIVLGSRFAGEIEEMPLQKKWGNMIATKVTSLLSGLKITDAQTGFRAFSKEAMLRMSISSDFTYTQETIIQAAFKGLRVREVPIRFLKRKHGSSRLFSSIFSYAWRAGLTIIKSVFYYAPMTFFSLAAAVSGLIGLAFGARVALHYSETGMVSPFIPSAIISAFLLLGAMVLFIAGMLANSLGASRRMQEETLYLERKRRYG